MIDRFRELLIELGIDLDIVLTPDSDGSCSLKVDNQLVVQIIPDKSENTILIGSFICEIPPGKFTENVFTYALKSNGQIPLHSTFAFNSPTSELVLFKYLPLEKTDKESLKAHLETFIEKAMKWKDAIETGHSAPLDFIRDLENSKSSIFTLSR